MYMTPTEELDERVESYSSENELVDLVDETHSESLTLSDRSGKVTQRRSRTEERSTYNPIKEYLREIGDFSLLTREEELSVYEQIEQGRLHLIEGLSRSRVAITSLEELVEDLKTGARSAHTTFRNPDAGRTRRKTELAKAIKEMTQCNKAIRKGFADEDAGQLSERQLVNRYKKWAQMLESLDLDVSALWKLARSMRDAYAQIRMKESLTDRKRLAKHFGESPKKLKAHYRLVREGLQLIRDARQMMIRGNLRLVVSVAKRYKHSGVPMLDLIQEGNLGLTRAVDKYDYQRGTKFSTYAVWWIRQSISRAVKQQRRTIRLPTGVTDQIAQVDRANFQLTQELGREPSVPELADRLEMDEDRIIDLIGWQQEPVSIETPIREDRETTVGELIKDGNIVPPESKIFYRVLAQRLDEILKHLSEREETILRLRYGFKDGKVWKLGDIGKRFGITRERVRQIEQRAIRKLRHPLRSREIRDFLN